ncbi:TFIIB-type zinc finger domain-containing protein [Clostridium sp.]|uniref:TFIIB-type zinc finger domain-containing protein n=1 Tax=Clostridium sp. TaxID=1506 RepID=UPI003D6CDBFE
MICNNCKNEFTKISGLNFCQYCGVKIEEKADLETEQIPNEVKSGEAESIVAAETMHQDTLDMPAITDEDIKKDKRDKFFATFKKTFVEMKVIIPIIALLAVIGIGLLVYNVFIVKPVDEARIKEDMIGKVITLPKGTTIKISEDYMKSFTIESRNEDKVKEDIKVALTLNNGVIESKILLALAYTYEGQNYWEVSDKIVLERVTSLKPVVGMDEKMFISGLKKLSIPIAGTKKILGEQEVKTLGIALRTADFGNGKEEIIVDTSIDSGILAAKGKIKCKLIFEDEVWKIKTIEQNSAEDFEVVLSKDLSDEKIIKTIKSKQMEETVTYPNFFEGKGFPVNDSFTKSISIAGKRLDMQNGVLYVTAKRENVSGQINMVLETGYTLPISFSEITLLKGAKTTVDSGTISKVPKELIISTITDAEIQGSNGFWPFSKNHKITAEEAKTFKAGEMLSQKGLENIKYVYGSIIYKDGSKDKTIAFVALYFLAYDDNNGYNWKLDKLDGEKSSNYREFSKTAKN